MKMKNKKFWYNFLYFALIIVVILGIAFFVWWLKSIGGECVADPVTFYQNRSNMVCSCFAGVP